MRDRDRGHGGARARKRRSFLPQHRKSSSIPAPPSSSTLARCSLISLAGALVIHPSETSHTMSQSSLKPSTIAAISAGTVVTGLLAYAVYFDHKRRNDPEFRKSLKRESKRTQRAAKEQEEAQGAEQKKAIREAVARANEEGFPKDPEEVEEYFMQEVAQGEGMVQKGMWSMDVVCL